MEKFYENKKVFITGGTGFLGRVLIEKILRSTDVQCIYFLIRPKRAQTPDERITQIFNDDLFAKLQQLKPKARKRLIPILGDFNQPRLGLSPEDYATLVANVNVIMHCAATVRFDESLHTALIINMRATNDMLELAKDIQHLEAFVHVSSAYANCPETRIEEQFYPHILSINGNSALKLIDALKPKLINDMQKSLLNGFPNTYTFTKALAEDLIRTRSAELPICILRPAIISSTYKEPISGWTNNFLGSIGFVYPILNGLLRTVLIRTNRLAQLVPVDLCANIILACAWQTATTIKPKVAAAKLDKGSTSTLTQQSKLPLIYNYAPLQQNAMTWAQYINDLISNVTDNAFVKMLHFPFFIECHSVWFHRLCAFIFDVIPNYFFDLFQVVRGNEKSVLKLYNKFRRGINFVEYFSMGDWQFGMENTNKLWNSLTLEDKNKFNFNMASIFWPEYNRSSLAGMRLHLAKDKPESLPKARERALRLLKIHRTVKYLLQIILVLSLIWLLRLSVSQ